MGRHKSLLTHVASVGAAPWRPRQRLEQRIEVNRNEMANADLRHAVTRLAPARTKLQLVKATAKHLRSVQQQPERIHHEPVKYAA